jgi:ParB family chromosome partitioning protein
LAQPHDVLLELLAYCVARTVHGVQSKADSSTARLQHADALALALDCDMSKWFTASAQNFFLRVSKSKIADALREAGKPVSIDGLKRKKAELAALAEKEIAGTGWLPEPIRVFLSPTAAGESSD